MRTKKQKWHRAGHGRYVCGTWVVEGKGIRWQLWERVEGEPDRQIGGFYRSKTDAQAAATTDRPADPHVQTTTPFAPGQITTQDPFGLLRHEVASLSLAIGALTNAIQTLSESIVAGRPPQ